jgi:superfamily II DNA or RNA helicase
LKDAIKEDILPDPKVYVVGMELGDKRHDQLIKIGKYESTVKVKWENRMKYISRNIPCNIMCTQKQKYQYYTETMEYWKERYEHSKNEYHHNLWVNTGSMRKRYLGEQKTADVYKFLDGMPSDKRYVCFCASVAQASMLGGKNTISSKRRSSVNQDIIDSFNQKRINSIYAVGMITEGMNLNDIQVGIIVQLDGKERLFIQKIGRVLRADSPVAVIFYYKNTQDENYLKGALENIDPKFVRYININQLNNIKL